MADSNSTTAPPAPAPAAAGQTNGSGDSQTVQDIDTRPIFFFDIDNCLYPHSYKIHDLMKVLIHQYFVNHLELTEEDATQLHRHYYTQYGLALSGLIRHHTIDVMEYNRLVDDSLPLETIIRPSPHLTHLLTTLRNSNTCAKLWLFTNAYVNHAQRVVKLLGIDHLFDGITYCDYEEGGRRGKLVCKPEREMFEKAMREAGLVAGKDEGRCVFVDDSRLNCLAAKGLGWGRVAHLVEPESGQECAPTSQGAKREKGGVVQISDLVELRDVFPELWKDGEGSGSGSGEKDRRVGREPLREETPGRELPRREETPLPEVDRAADVE